MSLAVVAICAGLVFIAELPDKTMIATVVMASRRPALPVWLGSSAAFVVHSAVAVAAGGLLTLLPRRWVDGVVAVLFLAAAVYLLVTKEEQAAEEGEEEAARVLSSRRVLLTAFGVILVGELGDVTQVLTANLAARYRQPLAVFAGASLGLIAVSGLGAIGGQALVRVLPLAVIRRVAGVVLAGFAVVSVVLALR